MIKIAIGILIGVTMAAAAQWVPPITTGPYKGATPIEIPPSFGADAQSRAQFIRVDDKGRVYCSPEPLP